MEKTAKSKFRANRAKIELLAGIIITVVIVYFLIKAVSGLDPRRLMHIHINWWLALLSAAIFAFSNYVRGLAYTLGNEKDIGYMDAFRIIGIGHAANMVLPLHAGEGLRLAFFPSEYSTLRRTQLIVLQGVCDFIVIVIMTVVSVPLTGFRQPLLGTLEKVALIFTGACAAAVIVIVCIPRLRAFFRRYMTMGTLKMFLWVFLSWMVILISIWIGLIAFGVHPLRSVRMSLAVFSATNFINYVPASPGGIGLFEYGVVLGLGGLGVHQQTAIILGIFLHLLQYVALMPLGAFLYFTSFKYKTGKKKKMDKSSEKSGLIEK